MSSILTAWESTGYHYYFTADSDHRSGGECIQQQNEA